MKIMLVFAALLLTTQTVQAFQCNECHSKNPAMVRMHKAVQGRDCFGCHKIGEKLMGKGIPRDKATQMKRRESDPLCVECHEKLIRQMLLKPKQARSSG